MKKGKGSGRASGKGGESGAGVSPRGQSRRGKSNGGTSVASAPTPKEGTVLVYRGGKLTRVSVAEEIERVREEQEARFKEEMKKKQMAAGRLWVCEHANDETMEQLARLANCSVLELQSRRHVGPDPECPDEAPEGRGRCWRCPFWTRHPDKTPF